MKRSQPRTTRNTLARLPKARLFLESLEERNLLSGLQVILPSRSPTPGGLGAGVSASARAQFNLPVDPTTLAGNVQLHRVSDLLQVPGRPSAISLTTAACNDPAYPYNCTVSFDPLDPVGPDPLAYGTTYRVTLVGNLQGTGLRALNGEDFLDHNETWTFTTARDPSTGTADYGNGLNPDGVPILVITSNLNPFSSYYAEILRAEGLNAFATCSIQTECNLDNVSDINNFDVVILGAMAIEASQVPALTQYVEAGGNLIAMRPDEDLGGLLGLGARIETRRDEYIKVREVAPGAGPGYGIVTETMKYHWFADHYPAPAPEMVIADLCTTASSCTTSPAVTLLSVGENGGMAAAFTYDLAQSVVLTRQGDPTAAGQNRVPRIPSGDKPTLITAYDLFAPPCPDATCSNFENSELHWNDLNKVAIPQADEQQRLLANLIGQMNLAKRPLPRLWYLPSYFGEDGVTKVQKAAIVMTADDHVSDATGSGTVLRFQTYAGLTPIGGKAVRSTSYIDCNHGEGRNPPPPGMHEPPLERQTCNQTGQPDDPDFAEWAARGFEIGLHPTLLDDSEGEFDEYAEFYDHQLPLWGDKYPSQPTPSTNRTDGVWWYNYDEQGKVEFDRRIRLDTNYMYWFDHYENPRSRDFSPGFIPGLFTGSGMIMRFASETGVMIDTFQATTQITDQSIQCNYFPGETWSDEYLENCDHYGVGPMPNTVEKLLRAAYNDGYYGVITVLSHTDRNISCDNLGSIHDSFCMSEKILARAREPERPTPVYSAREMLEWVDARSGSSFRGLSWDNHTLQFDIEAGVGAEHLLAMVPAHDAEGLPLSTFSGSQGEVILTCETIKGVEYAFFWANQSSYIATYDELGSICSPGSAPLSGGSSDMQLLDLQPALAWFVVEELDPENSQSGVFVCSVSNIFSEGCSYTPPLSATGAVPLVSKNVEEETVLASVDGTEVPVAPLNTLFTDLGQTVFLVSISE